MPEINPVQNKSHLEHIYSQSGIVTWSSPKHEHIKANVDAVVREQGTDIGCGVQR
ncbi:hypothetical protein SESBI_34486 [Sesbania bispinosa]|nr:hypothetical protein SESBI_34486 [Sesbania bispinosa]